MNGSAKRWERARAHTRACILEAAAEAFQSSGYDNACMQQIADLAGYTKATVYAHYRDKANLFTAVMNLHASSLPEPVVRAHAGADLKEELDYVSLEIQKLAQLDVCRRFCGALRHSATGTTAYAELWSAYLAPFRAYICSALAREGVDRAEEYASLYLQLLLQTNSLQTAPQPATNAGAMLSVFHRAFQQCSSRG
ncbi:TetR/AcrR family transcriptional regulator [Stenotrophomonas maltophilia]|uniref:TetR/AcrR family transcriptional regulator n=1 Tax=Stenotrophomonas maltophilia TaxID=40324 RepID=A0AA40XWV0_STEMA|nr:TetR/AcrR family transcriptional regulator [Stenotrophomonas maltophilia]